VTGVPPSPNRELLLRVARRLGPVLDELVFVGGQVAELLVTDPAAVRVRPIPAPPSAGGAIQRACRST
jgi:hypothetical protein